MAEVSKFAEADWVFIRGLARERRHWHQFPQSFAAKIDHCVTHAFDLPGTGMAYDQAAPLSIQANMMSLRERYFRLHRPGARPTFLFAISMGAMVAVEWARQFPDEISGLVLVNTSFANFSRFTERLKPEQWLTLLRIAQEPDLKAREMKVLAMTTNLVVGKDQIAADFAKLSLENPISKQTAIRQLIAAANYKAPQESPHSKILLLAGGRDRMVSSDCSLAISKKWQCPLHVHPTAGHDLPLDAPQWAIGKVKEWLHESVLNSGNEVPIASHS